MSDFGNSVSSPTVTATSPPSQRELRTAFVDAVATKPSHQARGFARMAMRELAEGIDEYEIGCLQTDKPAFYERLGWEPWRGLLTGREGGHLVPTPDQQGVMVLRLPATPPLDLDAGPSIERQPNRFWE